MITPRRRIALVLSAVLLVSSAVAAFAATTQAGAAMLLYPLEVQSSPARPESVGAQAEAIVVLTGDATRIDAGARLALATGVPLAIVGRGAAAVDGVPESESLEDRLLRSYGIGPRWVETESKDTRENAVFAWCLLSGFGVTKIALVTNAYHMPRARRRFEAVGFQVIAAPLPDGPVLHTHPLTWRSFVPSRAGREDAHVALHEWGGLLLAPIERLRDPPRPCPYRAVLKRP